MQTEGALVQTLSGLATQTVRTNSILTISVLTLSGLATKTARTNSVLTLSILTHSCLTTQTVMTNSVLTLSVLTLSSLATAAASRYCHCFQICSGQPDNARIQGFLLLYFLVI